MSTISQPPTLREQRCTIVVWSVLIVVCGITLLPDSRVPAHRLLVPLKSSAESLLLFFKAGPIFVTARSLLASIPLLIWLLAGRHEPATEARTVRRVLVLGKASLGLYVIVGLFLRVIPWVGDLLVVYHAQLLFLSWLAIGAYALFLSIRLRRGDLIIRAAFSAALPPAIYCYYLSHSFGH